MTLHRHPTIAPAAWLLVAAWMSLSSLAQGAPIDPEALLRQGKVDEALTVVLAQAQAGPDDIVAQELYVDFMLNLGRAEVARQHFAARVQNEPMNPNAHYLLGRATVDARVARTAYERALRIQPEHARSHMGIAAVHAALGKPADAEAAYARAVSLDPSLSEAWIGLIRARLAAGDQEGATKVARQAHGSVVRDPQIAMTLATLDPQGAGAVLSATLPFASDDGPLQAAWAQERLKAGDAKGAMEAAQKALAVDPSLLTALRANMAAKEIIEQRLSLAAWKTIDDATARQVAPDGLDALLRQHPRSVILLLTRANVRKSGGDDAGAMSDLASAVAADPSHVEAKAAYGKELLDAGRAADAAPLLQAAAAARPWEVRLRIDAADALMSSGAKVAGLAAFEQLIIDHPTDIAARGSLARALLDVGRADDAFRRTREALGAMPDPWLATIFIMVSEESGHHAEGADFLLALAKRSGSAELEARAADLRRRAVTAPPAPTKSP
jgi:predicted Zn-dependent protease